MPFDDIDKMMNEMMKGLNIGSLIDPRTILNNTMRTLTINQLEELGTMIDDQVNILKKEYETSSRKGPFARPSADTKDNEGMNPFTILGVDRLCSKEELKNAFRNKAYSAHPDHGGTHEKMVKVNAAYEAIKRYRGWD